ncbi:MAG: SUMF1/EgtB/PvdO family nonheme iron enzyme [Polyangiaceae bacterium]|nr:SUMF1/EgtB/PvdO family nonheme iron enzyme [Polyangiaceae bacterium]
MFAMMAVAGACSALLAGQHTAADRSQGAEPTTAAPGAALVPEWANDPEDASAGVDPEPWSEAGDANVCPAPAPTKEIHAHPAEASTSCPADMVLVEGEYCTKVRQRCSHWLDDRKLPYARCGRYEQPAECVAKRERMRFCIDRYEQTLPGQALPVNYMSLTRASKLCSKLGRRICLEKEWTFACEGEAMQPYPYGWSRQPLCNQDHEDLYDPNAKPQVLRDLRESARAHPECVSPFGVVNMVGNVDEPVLSDVARYQAPFSNVLKGGWWLPGRNRCRPATVGHDDHYRDVQIGARCCKDAGSG